MQIMLVRIILDLPNVTAISPQLINVPIGKKLQLLVRLKGSYYPTPTINWIHSDNKLTNQTTLITANDRIAFNGVLGINLTIENVNVNDSGAYFLKVANNVEEILLHFNISILGKWTILFRKLDEAVILF